VPLRTALQNGDQVEILRSKTQTPSPTWLNFVVTGKARSCVNRFIRNQQRQQYIDLGKAILQKAFRESGHQLNEKALDSAIRILKIETIEDLHVAVGDGTLTGRAVLDAIFPGERKPASADDEKVVPLARARGKGAGKGGGIPIRGLIPGMAMHFAGCCHPLPGDRIVGIVTTGKGVTIHTIDCETLEQFVQTPERWIDVSWDPDGGDSDQRHVGRVSVVVTNEPGSLSALSTTIAKNQGNITNLKITSRGQDFFEMIVDIEVRDVKHLSNIIAALRADPAINSVERARG